MHTVEEACAALDEILVQSRFSDAGRLVVVEEFVHGEKLSFFAVSEGNVALPLATAPDHEPLAMAIPARTPVAWARAGRLPCATPAWRSTSSTRTSSRFSNTMSGSAALSTRSCALA